jgi:hypothetical protein
LAKPDAMPLNLRATATNRNKRKAADALANTGGEERLGGNGQLALCQRCRLLTRNNCGRNAVGPVMRRITTP